MDRAGVFAMAAQLATMNKAELFRITNYVMVLIKRGVNYLGPVTMQKEVIRTVVLKWLCVCETRLRALLRANA